MSTIIEPWDHFVYQKEKRRIQNRNAQRRFRKAPLLPDFWGTNHDATGAKKREAAYATARQEMNKLYAGLIYTAATADVLLGGDNISGLPWGGINMKYIVARGYEYSSQQARNFLLLRNIMSASDIVSRRTPTYRVYSLRNGNLRTEFVLYSKVC